MGDIETPRTSQTLLRRVAQPDFDQTAWNEFVDLYGPLVFRWCCAWGLQAADAEDVTQNVLLDLARQMTSFEYSPSGSFRGWLRTVTRRARCDHFSHSSRPGGGSGDSRVLRLLLSVEARDALAQQCAADCDRELFELAAAQVRLRVEPRTWESFRLTAVEGLSGAAAAQRLGLAVLAVFQNKSRVQRMLRDEIRRLDAS